MGAQTKFWLVWCPNRGYPTHQHGTEGSATTEAERLARRHPTEEFHVLESVGTARVPETPVEWVKHVPPAPEDDDIPF